ncbi:hypothetical protein BLOT_013716 [Blomia tropicalis]|nr:hypothetical protein BLOT_013716 [Blomia tropicalis]
MNEVVELNSENKSKPINVLAIDQTLRKYRMKQPFKILTDIWGVLIPYHFVPNSTDILTNIFMIIFLLTIITRSLFFYC